MKKQMTAVLAVLVAATVLLAGTYAWSSISQKAINRVSGVLNPGGRLHDDFTGINTEASDGKLKRVYVENFTEENGGVSIYARVRLDEYLEIGDGAGRAIANKKVTVIENTQENLGNTAKWVTYQWGESAFRDYVDINLGENTTWDLLNDGSLVGAQPAVPYMPTFNKDKDSNEADVNGTVEGPDRNMETPADAYMDYIPYGDGNNGTVRTEAGVEIYAENKKGTDEILLAGMTAESIIKSALGTDGRFAGITGTVTDGTTQWFIELYRANLKDKVSCPIIAFSPENAVNAEDFTAVQIDLNGNQEADIRLELTADHEVRSTEATEKLISMDQWQKLDESEKTGNYWVYDTDGWAYWAKPIKPQSASGCLFSSISKNTTRGNRLESQEFYYGLNVVAQCATAGDWGEDTEGAETGFYVGGITDNALELLNTISGTGVMNSQKKGYTVTITYPDESVGTLTVADGAVSGEPAVGWENLFLTAYVDGEKTDSLKDTLEGLKKDAEVTYTYISRTDDPSDPQNGMTMQMDGTVVFDGAADHMGQMMVPDASDDYYVFQTSARAENFSDGSIGFALTADECPVHIGIDRDGELEIRADAAGTDPEGMATFALKEAPDWTNGVKLAFVNYNGEFSLCVNGRRFASFGNHVRSTRDRGAADDSAIRLTNAIGVSASGRGKVSFTDYHYETGEAAVTEYLGNLPKELDTAYISADGNDLSAGTSVFPLETLTTALDAVNDGGTIVVKGDYAVPSDFIWNGNEKTITIQGADGTLDLSAFSEFFIGDSVTFQELALDLKTGARVYANGHRLEIAESVQSNGVIELFGGGKGNTVESTNLIVKAGNYTNIYGGGNGGAVSGDTNLYVGGAANSSADAASHSKVYAVYGGGLNDTVNGNANLTFADNAKANYVYGGSSGSGSVNGTNVMFSGGKTMALYGGNCASSNISSVRVTVSGGEMEQLFGGCEAASMTGNITVALTGGKITRRVYGGCYNECVLNNWTPKWNSERSVKGSIDLKISGGVSITMDAKDSNGSTYSDTSIFACSRRAAKPADEICTITFMDQTAYDKYYGKLGAQDFAMKVFMSPTDTWYDAIVKAWE